MTTACRTSSCLNSSRLDSFFFDMVADMCDIASWEMATVESILLKERIGFLGELTGRFTK